MEHNTVISGSITGTAIPQGIYYVMNNDSQLEVLKKENSMLKGKLQSALIQIAMLRGVEVSGVAVNIF